MPYIAGNELGDVTSLSEVGEVYLFSFYLVIFLFSFFLGENSSHFVTQYQEKSWQPNEKFTEMAFPDLVSFVPFSFLFLPQLSALQSDNSTGPYFSHSLFFLLFFAKRIFFFLYFHIQTFSHLLDSLHEWTISPLPFPLRNHISILTHTTFCYCTFFYFLTSAKFAPINFYLIFEASTYSSATYEG